MLLLLKKLSRTLKVIVHLKMRANLMSQVLMPANLKSLLSSVLSKWIKTIRLSPFQPDQTSFHTAHSLSTSMQLAVTVKTSSNKLCASASTSSMANQTARKKSRKLPMPKQQESRADSSSQDAASSTYPTSISKFMPPTTSDQSL